MEEVTEEAMISEQTQAGTSGTAIPDSSRAIINNLKLLMQYQNALYPALSFCSSVPWLRFRQMTA